MPGVVQSNLERDSIDMLVLVKLRRSGLLRMQAIGLVVPKGSALVMWHLALIGKYVLTGRSGFVETHLETDCLGAVER